MALMRPVANCDFNHTFEHGSASTAKVSPTMFQNRNKYFRRLFIVHFQSRPGFMALMSPVANCDFNHNFEHGSASTAKVSPTMFQNSNKYFRRLFIVHFHSRPGFMALVRPVANCDFNHNFEHGSASTSKVSPTMFQNRNKYFRRLCIVRFQSRPGFMALMSPVANCDFNHNFEHGARALPKCRLPCYKTVINTSDDFS